MDASGGPSFKSTADLFNYINPNTFKDTDLFTDFGFSDKPIFDEKGQFTDEFKDLKPTGLFDSQDDVLEQILNNIEKRGGMGIDPLQKLILEEQLKRAKEGEQISFNLFNTPYFQRQRGIVGLPQFQLASLGGPTYTDTGIVSVFPDLATQIRQEQAAAGQRAQAAAEAQESRNESRDDYTGGGGTVVIGKGGGETKTVSPRSREAMYAAPTRTPEPPPFRRFNTGGVVGLFRRF